MGLPKKVIVVALVAAVVLVGSLAGLAVAQTGTGDTGQSKTLLERVASILGIDQQKLQDAVNQAQREMRDEALNSYLKNLVDQGKITQGQADQYNSWWQARPDTLLPGPFGRDFGSRGFKGGMRGGGGLWGGCPAPIPSPTPQASGSGL
jgi:hypothetical protein